MSPEKGLLEQYIEIKSAEGNTAAAEIARVLREQYGDELPGKIFLRREVAVNPLSLIKDLYTRKLIR